MILYILLCIMLAYLMQLTALLNIICLYNDYLFFAIDFLKYFLVLWFVFGLFTYSLFISNIILHFVQCFYSVDFLYFIFTPLFNDWAKCNSCTVVLLCFMAGPDYKNTNHGTTSWRWRVNDLISSDYSAYFSNDYNIWYFQIKSETINPFSL